MFKFVLFLTLAVSATLSATVLNAEVFKCRDQREDPVLRYGLCHRQAFQKFSPTARQLPSSNNRRPGKIWRLQNQTAEPGAEDQRAQAAPSAQIQNPAPNDADAVANCVRDASNTRGAAQNVKAN